MKKMAFALAVLMIAAAVPGWCLVESVDGYVDTHTKNSSLRPVQDTGELYKAVNHGIGTQMDKVPGIKSRQKAVHPVEKFTKDSIHVTKTFVNGVWDVITLKPLREKK